jgi:hypothetical protein
MVLLLGVFVVLIAGVRLEESPLRGLVTANDEPPWEGRDASPARKLDEGKQEHPMYVCMYVCVCVCVFDEPHSKERDASLVRKLDEGKCMYACIHAYMHTVHTCTHA